MPGHDLARLTADLNRQAEELRRAFHSFGRQDLRDAQIDPGELLNGDLRRPARLLGRRLRRRRGG